MSQECERCAALSAIHADRICACWAAAAAVRQTGSKQVTSVVTSHTHHPRLDLCDGHRAYKQPQRAAANMHLAVTPSSHTHPGPRPALLLPAACTSRIDELRQPRAVGITNTTYECDHRCPAIIVTAAVAVRSSSCSPRVADARVTPPGRDRAWQAGRQAGLHDSSRTRNAPMQQSQKRP